MSSSKILIAIENFKAEYAWDKSLSAVSAPVLAAAPPVEFDPLQRFQELSNGRRPE